MTSVETSVTKRMRYDFDVQEIEILNDLLSSSAGPEESLTEGLDYILKTINRPYGLIYISTPGPYKSVYWIKNHIPEVWSQELSQADSFLNRKIRETRETGQPFLQLNPHLISTILPVFLSGEVVGVMVVGGTPASEEELQRWKLFLNPIARFILLTRKINELSGRQPDQMVLNLLTAAQNTNLDINDIELVIARGIKEIFVAQKIALYLLDSDNPTFAILKTMTEYHDWSSQGSITMLAGPVQEAISSGQAVEVLGMGSVPADAGAKALEDDLGGSRQICTPLIANGQTFGALQVIGIQKSPLDSFELGLLLSLSTALANALLNRQLFQKLNVSNADLEASRWELLNSRNTLRALFDSIPARLYIIDPQYNLVAVNMSRAAKAGGHPNRMVRRKCYEMLFHANAPCAGCLVQKTFQDGSSTERLCTDAQSVEWEISTFPILANQSSQTAQVIVLEQDVTEKKRMEANLIQSEKLAAIGQLAAGVAHEINNPLAAIVANAQMAERAMAEYDDPDLKESIELILMAGTRASHVVYSLLEFAHTDWLEMEPFDLNENIMRAVALLQHEIISHHVSLDLSLTGSLPRIFGNKHQLEGVWVNILMNAIEASGDENNRITVSTRYANEKFQVLVKDTGCGIPADQINHIFEPFFTTKAPGIGTGLGLSMCYRTIQQHQGTIEVESQAGKGTLFTISLPARSEN